MDGGRGGGRGGVLHTGMPAPFHHIVWKFPWKLEGWKVGRLGGWEVGRLGGWRVGGGGGQSEKGRRKKRKRCDDRAEGAVFVHASEGKLITRRSPTPLKC